MPPECNCGEPGHRHAHWCSIHHEPATPPPAEPKLPGGYGPDYVTRKELVEALRCSANTLTDSFVSRLADKLEARGGR